MSSKIAVKSPAGLHQQSKITGSPQWNSSGTTATSSRLAKAKSSPNVSRTSSQQLSATKQTIKIDDTRRKNNPSSAGSKSSSSAAPKSTARSHNNVTIVQIPGETRSAAPTPRSRTSDARSKKPEAAAPKKKQPLKERSPSCTILEDRVLLKKGLAPAKKPEAELRRKCLNRSTSLWSVQTPPPQESSARKLSKSADSQKLQKKSSRPTLNRATSLWSVPADPQCRLGKMPSRIPLSTQHLGQSLGDLSLVDRPVEQQPAMIVKAIDFDEVDRSVDEHIYENCREAVVVQVNKQEEAIYEELDKVVGKSELTMSLSVPLTTSELEKRAEQLLSQLDEDDSANVIAPVEPVRLHRSKDTESHKENVRQEPLEKSHRLLAKSQDSLQVLSQAVPPSPSKRTECEMSIQEIRRNWERQIEKCSSDELKTSPSKKRLSKSSTNINAGSALSLAADSNKRQQQQQQQQQQVIAAKRTKEIEHLVHFFNCKNTESPKPIVPGIVIQDTWKPLLKNEPVEEITTPSSEKPGKLEKSCGYASDGNSSEDSGHISNENEDEHQQGSRLKSEIFLEEIIQDLDTSLERTIEVFEATPIVRRFVPPSGPPPPVPTSSSSPTSSIESWDEALKLSRKKSIEKLPVPPKPTQRHNVPTSTNSAQIFFRAGALERLESQRDEKLTGHIILLQARCRGYLARRKLNTLKLQDLAVRCIQRNVRKLMSVREWPWWRLYVKVAPLLNVHRTEDQLKARTEELEVLRAKVDRLEQERNHLKHDNDRLEAKSKIRETSKITRASEYKSKKKKKEPDPTIVTLLHAMPIGFLRRHDASRKMPLSPTTYFEPMPSSSASSLHLDGANGSSVYSDDPASVSSTSLSSHLTRRPPLPPISSHFYPRPLSKIAVIRPNSAASLISRSPSPRLSSLRSLSCQSPTPRRIFPQESSCDEDEQLDLEELSSKEQAPVVFDASLNFVLGIDKQKVRQSFRPTASHLEPQTASSYLSSKISNFLQRTDHIMDEWKRIGRSSGDEATTMSCTSPDGRRRRNLARSKSATNILIKGYQYFSRSSSVAKSPSRPVSRLSEARSEDDRTLSQCDEELSEMTADFAEEHSTSTLAAERIDAEQSERLRLERELQDVSETNKSLQQQAERLEMELLYARAADLNGLASDAEDAEADGGVYKQRYQHAMRELDFTKRKMAQQHEDDLEQLVGLKKQLEKKLADAYEEVEEQRQVVGQWKRRVQKLNGEMHDLRLLLEEQTARNNLLEKKQRKFDSETQNLMDDLRQEKAQRERLAREKEIAIAEKFTIEQNLSDARLEIELKEERLHTLSQELEELTFGGKTEEEVAQLKKAKHELEKKLKDQEEELDDLAGQVQLLEQAKLRLEMSIEQQRKEMRKEMQQRDEELEDVRGSAMKKVKALEAQLENEHEERTIVLREKHELERRLVALEDQDRTERAAEAETTQRLKRDLKRTRALLRDAQTMLERSKGDSTGKTALRHLKNQLEDAECARAVAVKAKQALEQDLSETQAALEEASRQRSEAEDRANAANRERAELLSQLEENEEELAEVLKKYRAAVQQVSVEQAQLQEAQVQIAALEAEKSSLKDQLSELSQRLESVEQLGDPTANSLATRRLEFRTKELESKLELEQTTRARLETQIARLKENVEKLQSETALLRTKEQSAQDAARRLQRSLREAREEAATASAREQEATRARRDLEKALEAAEAETKVVKDDLRLALQRIEDLQSAIQGELDLDCSEEATSDNSDRQPLCTVLITPIVKKFGSPAANAKASYFAKNPISCLCPFANGIRGTPSEKSDFP
ncbi:hypothetical protein TSAR_014276 [Trichomalopsis sarcophagae]|uniref:Uncharacterized protein n=1 Tax=Trichomalopsis sarcophagae TaxID=543379 RepID=A0A232FLJ1_9HYME|nr:hypothetical protein TSAR_014276 [Trichomalopsis sarcophagae]